MYNETRGLVNKAIMFEKIMEPPRYLLNRFGYVISRIVYLIACGQARIGISKEFCYTLRASKAFGEGGRAYERGDYEVCYEILSPYLAAEQDGVHGGIKYHLGLLFFYGRGVTLNRGQANKLFEEAALLGWEQAQQYLSQFKGRSSEEHYN
ncbi:MAG: SEL1-like repeat protein [Candidatus Thiodiazotropha sp. (ex. Lucinisca nassula)]|nr:SEL1-like repeat protein [Candidatus Thiodiazotropha sp. (ex. Lucinisca nassula)]